jgi:hypothetical protein
MATIQEHIKATGKLNILVTGADGKVKQDLFVPNLVVSLGKDYIAGRMKDSSSPYVTPIQMGFMAVGEVSESYNYGIASSVSQFGPFTHNQALAAEIASSRTALTTAGGTQGITAITTGTASSGSTSITVASGTGIAVGMFVHGQGIAAGTKVASGSGTSWTLDTNTTAALVQPASLPTATGTSGAKTIVVSDATNVAVGQTVTGTGIGLNATVYSIAGTTITLDIANSGTVSGDMTFRQPVIFTNANTITYACTFLPGVGTGAIVEAGIFNESSPSGTTSGNAGSYASTRTGGTMLCRTTFAVVNKGADDTMSITWTVTIS